MKALVIAGTASGVGKTTVATGLIAALRRRRLVVQPFKVGPDYIDPTYHQAAAGRASRNLDSWMLSPDAVRELFARAGAGSDIAVVEGVMGLYDGKSGGAEVGSTAHVARLIGAPVILVIDAARMARSAAALALGFRRLDPDLDLAGVILNNVATAVHYAAAAEAIEREAGLPVLGWLPRNSTWRFEERYLGLVPTSERRLDAQTLERLADAIAEGIDLGRLLRIASRARQPSHPSPVVFPGEPRPRLVRIAVARDEAFSFYYEDNLDLLQAWGAELVPFSPRRDEQFPSDTSGVYIGGGFPELHAADLAANEGLLADLRTRARAAMPIYAECGGLMYLAEGLVDASGQRHGMAGLLPGWSGLQGGRLTLGYRELQARRDSVLTRAGEHLRGHEFHWSAGDPPDQVQAAYDVVGDTGRVEGYVAGNVLASYIHLHFATDARLAPRFVEAATAWRRAHDPGRSEGCVSAFPPSSGKDPRSHCHPEDKESQDHERADTSRAGPLLRRYGMPPDRIEALSLRRLGELLGQRLPPKEPERSLVARLVYAAGDLALAEQVAISGDAIGAALAALHTGASVVVDVRMVAAGLNHADLARLGCPVLVAVDTPGGSEIALEERITRAAAGMIALRERLDGSVVAVGNAPTALLAILDLVDAGQARPGVIIGLPVGFVAATESKAALLSSGIPCLAVRGTRGGSGLAAAALNHLLRLASSAQLAVERHHDA